MRCLLAHDAANNHRPVSLLRCGAAQERGREEHHTNCRIQNVFVIMVVFCAVESLDMLVADIRNPAQLTDLGQDKSPKTRRHEYDRSHFRTTIFRHQIVQESGSMAEQRLNWSVFETVGIPVVREYPGLGYGLGQHVTVG